MKITNILLSVLLLSFILFCTGCSEDTVLIYDSELGDGMREAGGQVFIQGIGIQKEEDVSQKVLEIQGAVSGEEFLDIFDKICYARLTTKYG